ncbi:MAG: hypothetical protein ACE15B_19350 [Bryobacteraceae bacterium]
MSRLTGYRILALIPGMESTLARYKREGKKGPAHRIHKRLEMYWAELAEIQKTGHIDRSNQDTTHLFSTKPSGHIDRFGGDMEEKNALTIAGEQIEAGREQEQLLELGKWIGRRQAFGMLAASCSLADAQCLKRIKETGAYKLTGLPWEQFCPAHLGADRKTVERIISSLDQHGADYFTLRSIVRVSPQTYGLIASAVTESAIEFDGEKIPITKANAERISQAVAALRKLAEQKDEQIQEKVRDAKKLKEERDAAKKAAEREHQRLLDLQQAEAQLFPNAGPEHKKMLQIQSRLDMCFAQLLALGKKDLGTEDQGRLIGLLEYGFRSLTQISCAVRSEFGMGWNMVEAGEEFASETFHSGARNLVEEYAAANAGAGNKKQQ